MPKREVSLGAHVSIAKGLLGAVEETHRLGGQTFQIFSRNPRGRGEKVISAEEVARAHGLMNEYGIHSFYIHTPYYTNLASPNDKTWHASITYILDDLKRAKLLGATGFVTHLGNHLGSGETLGLRRLADALKKIFDQDETKMPILLENTAGAGTEIGNTFESLGQIINRFRRAQGSALRLQICLDTCHSFAQGYDWRTSASVKKNLDEFDKKIGLSRLALIHLNDSQGELGKHKDRHAHIGKGFIGLDGFRAILSDSRLRDKDFVFETPEDEAGTHEDDMLLLRKLSV